MPQPSPGLIVHTAHPLNAEPPLGSLIEHFVTPVDRFYIRTHGSLPRLDAERHRLRVDGRVTNPIEMTVRDLRERFPRRSVTATLQCAGNRREELDEVRPVTGTKWEPGAIGTAEWAGAALGDVLSAAGCPEGGDLHVAFASVDEVAEEGQRFTYGASIPLAKALGAEVLLAYEMNGAPLAPEHGFPLRVVVPGYVGVRSVKWVVAVRVQDKPSENYFQRKDYKLFPPGVTQQTMDPDAGMTLYDFPLNAAICEPADDARLPSGPVAVRGYALAAGRAIERVELTADGGRSWVEAELERQQGNPWAWTLWHGRLDLPPGEHEIAVRAWDAAAQTQPEHPAEVWNFKGYVNSAWHRVRVRIG